jgi:hypothetical protein
MESHANASTALTPNHCRKTDQYESLGEWSQLHIAVTNRGTLPATARITY